MTVQPPLCSWDLTDGVVVVRVVGEIDVFNAEIFGDSLSAAVSLASSAVVVDLSGLSFIDTAGTRALLQARDDAGAQGIVLVLAAPSQVASQLLRRTVRGRMPRTYDSVFRAVTRYRRPMSRVRVLPGSGAWQLHAEDGPRRAGS